MSNVLVSEYSLMNIADAIRSKNGLTTTYKPREMPAAIRAIETGTVVTGDDSYIDDDTLVVNNSGSIPSPQPSGPGLTEIDSFVLTADAHTISIPYNSEWTQYDFIVFRSNLTLTASDYLYFMLDATSPSGNNYTNSMQSVNELTFASKNGTSFYLKLPGTRLVAITVSSGKTLTIVPYTSSKNFVSGSYIKIYGGSLTDF